MSDINELLAELQAAAELTKQACAVERSAWQDRAEASKVWMLACANSVAVSAQERAIVAKVQAHLDARKAAQV